MNIKFFTLLWILSPLCIGAMVAPINNSRLVKAIDAGDVQTVKQIINNGFNVNEIIKEPNVAALDLAWTAAANDFRQDRMVSANHKEIFRFLKSKGARRQAVYGLVGPVGQRSHLDEIREQLGESNFNF